MTFTNHARPVAPFRSAAASERQARYLAWKERLMHPDHDADASVPADPPPSRWSVEALFADPALGGPGLSAS